MRLIEFAVAAAPFAPCLDEFSGLVELQDARVAAGRTRVALGHEDVAIRRCDHIVRLKEILGFVAAARFTERQEHLAIGAEFEYLMAFGGCRICALRRRRGACAASA